MSYHDLYVTTEEIPRTSIFDLPYGFSVECSRQTGWTLSFTNLDTMGMRVVAGEYNDNWMVLDVKGHVIVDSRPASEKVL